MNESKSDEHLIQLYNSGDVKALDKLIEKHTNFIFKCIDAKIKDVAISKDILQETFIKVYLSLNKTGKYQENGKFKAWVLRIANNMVMDYFRRKENHPSFKQELNKVLLYNYFDEEFEIEVDLRLEKKYSRIKLLIEQLPPNYKEVIKLRLENEFSFKYIAELKGVTINSALGTYRNAILTLRKELRKANIIK